MYGPELKQGTTIAGRYILKEYKGSGSFVEVWLAEDSELGIDVAIKLYISLDQKGQDEFKDEYKVAYGLSHENLLTAQYYSVWDHRPYLIMKYCSRGSAGSIGGYATEADIWKFIHDVANGLKYLHAQEPPIVHQDIKPENILIDEQGNYLITDFGISKKMRTTMRKQSKRSIESGAIAYMGPERFLKDPMAVKASDIWSLGVSIYEMATNDLPFMGQGGGMLNAGAALPELDEKWSRNLNEVMQACLSKETWDRPTAEDLADYTQQVLKGRDISWSRWKAGEDTPEAPELSKKWIVPTGIIGAVAITLFCVFIFGGKSEGGSQDASQQRLIEQRYSNLKSMCENNINVGSPQNYTSLISAKKLIDSLNRYQREYDFISSRQDHSVESLELLLSEKLDEAQSAWMRSAEGQLDIADDVSAAIMYYHIAANIKNSEDVDSALSKIAHKTGCNGAYMAVTNAVVNGNKLMIDYNGLNPTTIDGVTIRYALEDSEGKNVLKGQAIVSITPGDGQRVVIALNDSPSGQNNIILSDKDVVFYNSNN
ncbi:MAG: serine/threonine-protein kinase [Bacteroidales bacterium]|nr:serine/threonine-protein kinase [Bacteroidales bacterium]